jgi:hypothetical protein
MLVEQKRTLQKGMETFQKDGPVIFCCLNNYETISYNHHKVRTLWAYVEAGYENKF